MQVYDKFTHTTYLESSADFTLDNILDAKYHLLENGLNPITVKAHPNLIHNILQECAANPWHFTWLPNNIFAYGMHFIPDREVCNSWQIHCSEKTTLGLRNL